MREGGTSSSLWILVSGALRVVKGDVAVNTIVEPGAVIGEMSLLLGVRHSATVEATEPSRLRFAANGHALLDGNPEHALRYPPNLRIRVDLVQVLHPLDPAG